MTSGDVTTNRLCGLWAKSLNPVEMAVLKVASWLPRSTRLPHDQMNTPIMFPATVRRAQMRAMFECRFLGVGITGRAVEVRRIPAGAPFNAARGAFDASQSSADRIARLFEGLIRFRGKPCSKGKFSLFTPMITSASRTIATCDRRISRICGLAKVAIPSFCFGLRNSLRVIAAAKSLPVQIFLLPG